MTCIKKSYSKDFNASLDIEGSKFNLILMKMIISTRSLSKITLNKESYETIMVKTLVESIDSKGKIVFRYWCFHGILCMFCCKSF